MKDIIGQRFGRLIVKYLAGYEILRNKNNRNGKGNQLYYCECDCGSYKVVRKSSLFQNTKSCGCLYKESRNIGGKSNKIHGQTIYKKTSEYNCWEDIKKRCYNKKRWDYKYYGGRGIIVCERWLNSFVNFYQDMGKKPSSVYTIDRINNDGNYEPSNCRWVTWKIQANNKRQGNQYKNLDNRQS